MSSSPPLDDLILRAKRLVQAGDLIGARALAKQAFALNKNDPDVLVLVSQIVDDPAQKRTALQRALHANPTHREAQQLLQALDGTPPDLDDDEDRPGPAPRPRLSLRRTVMSCLGCGVLLWIGMILVGTTLSKVFSSRAVVVQPIAVSALAAVTVGPTTTRSAPLVETSSDPLAQTATALQLGLQSTASSLTQMAATTTQVAALTQTATQQGALGATVVAQQTAVAASNALPGTLIVNGDQIAGLVSSKVQYAPIGNYPGRTIAPDGKHIAYSKPRQGLFVAHLDGSAEQPIPGLPVDKGEATWSPDSQWLTLSNLTDGKVYLVKPTDGVVHTVALTNATAGEPHQTNPAFAWSPNQQRLALLDTINIYGNNPQTSLYVIDMTHPDAAPLRIPLSGTDAKSPVFNHIIFEDVVWLGDDQHVLFSTNASLGVGASDTNFLFVVDLATQTQHTLRIYPQTELAQISTLTVAPDSQHLAISGYDPYHENHYKLILLGTDGRDLKVMSDATSSDTRFEWSPDSRFLLLMNYLNNNTLTLRWMQMDDLSVHDVLPGITGLYAPVWSPDSRALLVCQVTQARTPGQAAVGQTLLVPLAAGSTPVTLFDKLVCPRLWVP